MTNAKACLYLSKKLRSTATGIMLIFVASTTGCLQQRLQQARSQHQPSAARATRKIPRQRRQQTDARVKKLPVRMHKEPKIAVRIQGKINRIPLEQYIAGVVASEMPSRWHPQALRAQAIASRTYALWQMQQRADKPYHVQANVLDQVYKGTVNSQSPSAQAAQATRGLVVTWQGQLGHTYFHATCGDHTTDSQTVWGRSSPYLQGVPCGFCAAARKQYRWSVRVDWNTLNKAVRAQVPSGRIRQVHKGKTMRCGRLKHVQLVGRQTSQMPTTRLRQLLGYNRLPSTWITDIRNTATHVIFTGQGHGHGVGMCQWGALGMATAGHTAQQILQHYYPGTQLQRWY